MSGELTYLLLIFALLVIPRALQRASHRIVDALDHGHVRRVEEQLPLVRDRQDDVAADEFGPMQVVAIRGGQQARAVATFLEDRIGALEAGDPGPVGHARRDDEPVALLEDVDPIVQAADHHRGDGRHAVGRQALGLAAPQAALDGLGHGDHLRHRETHGRVDVDAPERGLLDCFDAGSRDRDLDLHVRRERRKAHRLGRDRLGIPPAAECPELVGPDDQVDLRSGVLGHELAQGVDRVGRGLADGRHRGRHGLVDRRSCDEHLGIRAREVGALTCHVAGHAGAAHTDRVLELHVGRRAGLDVRDVGDVLGRARH